MPTDCSKSLVIGYGNEWRCDDALGPAVARCVESFKLPGVQIRTAHQLLPEFAADLVGIAQVVFVDARYGPAENEAAPIIIEKLPTTGSDEMQATHICDPRMLLALARIVFGSAPLAWLVSVHGERFEHGESLSQLATLRVDEAARRITELLRYPERLRRIEDPQ